MFSLIPSDLPLSLRSPRTLAILGCAAASAIGMAVYLLQRKRPTPEELERERRDLLAHTGRITDGTIMDTMVNEAANPMPDAAVPTPQVIVYNYRIAGVTYECAQDVTSLAEYVRGIRSDLPVQVRYAPHNPGNSIIVADSWSGLRLTTTHPHPTQPQSPTLSQIATDPHS